MFFYYLGILSSGDLYLHPQPGLSNRKGQRGFRAACFGVDRRFHDRAWVQSRHRINLEWVIHFKIDHGIRIQILNGRNAGLTLYTVFDIGYSWRDISSRFALAASSNADEISSKKSQYSSSPISLVASMISVIKSSAFFMLCLSY